MPPRPWPVFLTIEPKMPKEPYVPTPEQIALAERRRAERAAKKAAVAAGKVEPTEEEKLVMEKCKFLKRDWVGVPGKDGEEQGGSQRKRAKIITWNVSIARSVELIRDKLMMAVIAVACSNSCPQVPSKLRISSSKLIVLGRELFPGSDCLRFVDRKPMLLAEFAHHSSSDIICLQVRLSIVLIQA